MGLKADLRKKIKSIIDAIDVILLNRYSNNVHRLLYSCRFWRDSEIVLVYASIVGEVDTWGIISAGLAEGKTIGLPRIVQDSLNFHVYDKEKMETGKFNIPQPMPVVPEITQEMLNSKNVLLLVPGVAFDRKRFRLGRGKGYYDRTIRFFKESHSHRVMCIGLCFEEQIIERVPTDIWDQQMDLVISNERII
jgi:5-formyltetrahydrofolate cyclo-ligase